MAPSLTEDQRIMLQEATTAQCRPPSGEQLSQLARNVRMTQKQVIYWCKIANTTGWPYGTSVSRPSSFYRTGEILQPTSVIAEELCTWAFGVVGPQVQHFRGEGLNPSNSSVKFVEFEDFFKTYVTSAHKSNIMLVLHTSVSDAFTSIASQAANLLSALRADGRSLEVRRCFVNVMDYDSACGAGEHYDLDASLGTVVVKLSQEDPVDEALLVFCTNDTGTPITLPKGHAVAFIPMTKHAVPTLKRTFTRVTINFFFITANSDCGHN